MKKIIMILAALFPAILLGIITTVVIPMILGDSVLELSPIIMISFSIITIGLTLAIGIKKSKEIGRKI